MNKQLLIIGNIWPEPDSTAAGIRMLQLIRVFQQHHFDITFVSNALKNDRSFPLKDLNIQTFDIRLNDSNFDEFAKKLDPHFVMFDRFLTEEQFGWRIAENCPNALRILDTEDLHFLREARDQSPQKSKNVDLQYLSNDIAKREIASIYRCDLSLIISNYEYNLLIETFKISDSILLYLPFMERAIDRSKVNLYPLFECRNHFISIGNFKHKPNWDAVLHLKNNIWNQIRNQLQDAEIHIYGAYAPGKIWQLHNENEGFLIKGWADNIEEVYVNAKVCLAPLQFGAGLKGKLINSMKYGTPNITTSIGAEAMHNDLDWNGFISDEPMDFAARAIELYNNKNVWKQAQLNGFNLINQCYSEEKFSKIFIDSIHSLSSDLKRHRLQNFIGSMLQHHRLKSTKYLSKWIEEKNAHS